jgi:UDPglucose 6-dehydrogenase
LSDPVIFDGRNIYDPEFLRTFGIRYFGIGRGEKSGG